MRINGTFVFRSAIFVCESTFKAIIIIVLVSVCVICMAFSKSCGKSGGYVSPVVCAVADHAIDTGHHPPVSGVDGVMAGCWLRQIPARRDFARYGGDVGVGLGLGVRRSAIRAPQGAASDFGAGIDAEPRPNGTIASRPSHSHARGSPPHRAPRTQVLAAGLQAANVSKSATGADFHGFGQPRRPSPASAADSSLRPRRWRAQSTEQLFAQCAQAWMESGRTSGNSVRSSAMRSTAAIPRLPAGGQETFAANCRATAVAKRFAIPSKESGVMVKLQKAE